MRVSTPASRPSASTTGATRARPSQRLEHLPRARCRAAASAVGGSCTSPSWVKRSTPVQSASVTTPTGRPASSTTTTAPCARLGIRLSASATVSSGPQRQRGVADGVPGLDPGHDVGDAVERDVLGQHGQPAAPGHRLGHPAAGHRGHVGHDDGHRRAGAVGRGQVDVEPRRHGGAAGDEEDVVVGEVGGERAAGRSVEEAHGEKTLPACGRSGTRRRRPARGRRRPRPRPNPVVMSYSAGPRGSSARTASIVSASAAVLSGR